MSNKVSLVVRTAPNTDFSFYHPKVFLAGSIEMNKAEDWQSQVINGLRDCMMTVYNPRRSDWDSTWEQVKTNKQFKKQVDWELNHIESCDFVVVYFDPNTQSPISLLELGILSQMKPNRTFVYCPEGFYRKGNVDILCERYKITMVETMSELISLLKATYILTKNNIVTPLKVEEAAEVLDD
jgi:hypothetical protein